jgi:ribonuclease P protein component
VAPVRRLSDPAAFARLRTTRHRARAGALSLAYVPAASASVPPRVAYAIGKRVGGAVVRNRLRRRLRAVFAGLPAAAVPAGDYLVGAAPEAAVLTFAEASSLVKRLLDAVRPPVASPS